VSAKEAGLAGECKGTWRNIKVDAWPMASSRKNAVHNMIKKGVGGAAGSDRRTGYATGI